MSKVNNFDVLRDMFTLNMDAKFAPIGTNLVSVDKKGVTCTITIGIDEATFNKLTSNAFVVGGLIVADGKDFEQLKREMERRCVSCEGPCREPYECLKCKKQRPCGDGSHCQACFAPTDPEEFAKLNSEAELRKQLEGKSRAQLQDLLTDTWDRFDLHSNERLDYLAEKEGAVSTAERDEIVEAIVGARLAAGFGPIDADEETGQ